MHRARLTNAGDEGFLFLFSLPLPFFEEGRTSSCQNRTRQRYSTYRAKECSFSRRRIKADYSHATEVIVRRMLPVQPPPSPREADIAAREGTRRLFIVGSGF